MIKTYLHIPEKLDRSIIEAAKSYNLTKAEILRQAIAKGINSMREQKATSARGLLKLAEIGKKYAMRGPKNSSARIDELLWEKDWSKDE